jgi:hypothetical protein
MAEYINIKGQNIEVVASDPANPTQGQIWYNSTSNTLKGLGLAPASFATGANRNTSSTKFNGGGGDTSAGLTYGGDNGASNNNITEEYNGTSWSGGGNLPAPRTQVNCGTAVGTQTAGICFGGFAPYLSSTIEYDGSAWGSGGNMSVARTTPMGLGSQTATLSFTGYKGGSPAQSNSTEEYDGTSWTTSGNYPGVTNNGGAAGIQTAGTGFAGSGPSPVRSTTNFYDGATWTAGPSYPGTTEGVRGLGTQTDIVSFGESTSTSLFDGSSWTSSITSPSVITGGAAMGTTSLALYTGGNGPPGNGTTTTLDYTGAGPTTVTITAS